MLNLNLNVAMGLALFLFVFYPVLIMFIFRKNAKVLSTICNVSFILYIILICILVFTNVTVKNGEVIISFIPNASWFSLNFCLFSFDKSNVMYNLIMFFPISTIVFVKSKIIFNCKKQFLKEQRGVILKTILISLFFSFFIEIMQFILPFLRTTEVFDLITNTISGVFGYVFFFSLILIYKTIQEKEHITKKK